MPKRSFDTMNSYYSYEDSNDIPNYPPPEPFRARCRLLDEEDIY